jgi:hypothetical protein
MTPCASRKSQTTQSKTTCVVFTCAVSRRIEKGVFLRHLCVCVCAHACVTKKEGVFVCAACESWCNMHSPRRSPRKVPHRKLATNPLRDDARLRTLLSSLDDDVQCASDWDIWVEAFLTRWISFLDETGTAAAEASYQDFGTTLTDLIRVINKLNVLVDQGVFAAPETVTVKARQITSEFSRAFEVVVQDLDDLIPMTIAHETKVHYSKFHLGAVLIRDGFAEYGRMSLAADACERLAPLLSDVVDKSVLLNMKYYTLKLQAFCDVMADLGLLPAMLKCREFVHHTAGSSNNSPSNDNPEAISNKVEAPEDEEEDVAMSALAQALSITPTQTVLMLENETPLPDKKETTPIVVKEEDWRINQIVEYPSLFVEAARLETGAGRSNDSASPSQDQENTLQLVPVYTPGNANHTALLAWSYPDFLVATGHNDELVVYQRRDLVPLGQRSAGSGGGGDNNDMTRSVSLWQREPAPYSSHGIDACTNNGGASRLERDPAPYSSCPSIKESIGRRTPSSSSSSGDSDPPVSSATSRLERDPAPYSSVAFLAEKDQVQVERDPALYSSSNVTEHSKSSLAAKEHESAPYSTAAAPTQRSSNKDSANLERDPAPHGMASSASSKDPADVKLERDPAPYNMASSTSNKDSAKVKLERDPAPYGMASSSPNKDSAQVKLERDPAPYGMASSNKDSIKVKPERDPAPYSSSNGQDKSTTKAVLERESAPYSATAPRNASPQTKVEREPAPYATASKQNDASNRNSERDPAPYASSNLNDQSRNSASEREPAPYSKAAPTRDSTTKNLEREASPYAMAKSKEQDSTKDKLGRDPAPYSSSNGPADAAKEKLEREPAPYAMASSKEKDAAKFKQDRESAPYSSNNASDKSKTKAGLEREAAPYSSVSPTKRTKSKDSLATKSDSVLAPNDASQGSDREKDRLDREAAPYSSTTGKNKSATSKKNSEREPAPYSLANEKDRAKGKDMSRANEKGAPVASSRNSKEVDSSKILEREPAPYSSVASLGHVNDSDARHCNSEREPAPYSVTSAGDGKEVDSSSVKLERDPAPYALSSAKKADKNRSNPKRELAPYSMANTGDKESNIGDRDPAPYSSVEPSATGKPSSGSEFFDEDGVRKLSDREAAPYSSGPPDDTSSNFRHDREPAPYSQGPQKSVGRVRWDPKKFYKGPNNSEKAGGSPVGSKSDSVEGSNRKGLLSRNKSKEMEPTSAPSDKPTTPGEQQRKPRRRLKQSLEELYNRARYRISKTLDKTRQRRQPKNKAASQKTGSDETILHDHDVHDTDDQDSVESESDSDRFLMLPSSTNSTDLDDVSESSTAQSDHDAPVAEVPMRELEKQAGNKRRVAKNRDVLALENQKATHCTSAPRQLLAIEDQRTTDYSDEDTFDNAPQKFVLAIEDQKPTPTDEILAVACGTSDQNDKGSSDMDSSSLSPAASDPCSHQSSLKAPTLMDDVSESSTVQSATYVPVREVQSRACNNEGATKTPNAPLLSIESAAMVEMSTLPANEKNQPEDVTPSIVSSDEKSVDTAHEAPKEANHPLVDPKGDSAVHNKKSTGNETTNTEKTGAKAKKPKKKAKDPVDEVSVDIAHEAPGEANRPLVDPKKADKKKGTDSEATNTEKSGTKKKLKAKAKDPVPQPHVSLPDKEESQPPRGKKNTPISVSNEQEKEKNGSVSVPDSTAKVDIIDKPAKASISTVQAKKALPAVVDDELRRKCYMWYARMGQPTREVMKRRVAKMDKTCDITPDDVDALPWICNGQMISASAMSKLILSLDAK